MGGDNKIMEQIYILYIYKVLRIFLLIMILSYYLGTLWYIITKHTTDSNS